KYGGISTGYKVRCPRSSIWYMTLSPSLYGVAVSPTTRTPGKCSLTDATMDLIVGVMRWHSSMMIVDTWLDIRSMLFFMLIGVENMTGSDVSFSPRELEKMLAGAPVPDVYFSKF